MTIPRETLMAYLDGELAPEDASNMEVEIASNPELKSYIEQQTALRQELRNAFEGIIAAPLPERLLVAASASPSLRWRITQMGKRISARSALLWSGIPAATLALGVVVGLVITPFSHEEITFMHGVPVARGSLALALNTRLSGQQTGTAAQIGLSFRNQTGHYCRTFETGGANPLAGVACREKGTWQIAVLARPLREEYAGAAYKLSGSTMPAAVRSAVRDMMQGIPLDAAGERRARARDWLGN